MQASEQKMITRREDGERVWLEMSGEIAHKASASPFRYEVIESEEAVGQAMLDELLNYASRKTGDTVMVLLGGRGAQAMYKLINKLSETDEIDHVLSRLHVFTQDALAPMRMANGLSFVRDFERLLGPNFFAKVKSFTPMQTETDDVEGELTGYLEKLKSLGGIDIFFSASGLRLMRHRIFATSSQIRELDITTSRA